MLLDRLARGLNTARSTVRVLAHQQDLQDEEKHLGEPQERQVAHLHAQLREVNQRP